MVLLETSPKDYVPKFRTHPKACILPSEVVLVVVLLQSVEVSPRVFRSVNMMQAVVTDVICRVTCKESRPETGHEQ